MTRHNVQMLPPHQFYFEDDEGNLQIDTYDADMLREQKMQAVRDWNEVNKFKPVAYTGHLFDFDQESYAKVSSLALMGIGSPTGTWTTADNIDVPADAAFMRGLFEAMINHGATTHAAQRKMKNDLLAMTDAAAIAAYEVPQCH